MSEELNFDPIPFIDGPHHQTIIGSVFNLNLEPKSVRKLIQLSDGDKLALEVTTPNSWKESDLTVVMVHGLCGSHQSPYLVRMVKRLEPLGIRVIRLNMRGAGSGKGLARKQYHCGRSDDVFEAMKVLKKECPNSPFVLVGFSLGGNISLKLAGELGALADRFLKGLIAICPPVDLLSSVRLFGKKENEKYENYFYRLMRDEIYYRQKVFKDIPRIRLPKKMKLYEFDQLYVAPHAGFSDVLDYYTKCSAVNVAEEIVIPTKVLFAIDDPIVAANGLDHCNLHPNVRVYKTQKGGHMGFLSSPLRESGLYWLDGVLQDWILEFL